MLLHSFPDINMVRQLKNNAARGAGEWRNVVLNFECREASRLNLESPYSLFLNLRGHSYCSINRNQYRIETGSFLFSQPGDIYGLTIDNMDKTEICNVHINKRFFEQVAYTIMHSDARLLDEPEPTGNMGIKLFTQLHHRSQGLNSILDRLTQPATYSNGLFEPVLMRLVEGLLLQNDVIKNEINKLPFVKAAVREDIYRRLALGRDYIASNYHTALDLDEVCRETGMSKFHFLRLFKAHYGITPHQYLTDVRMAKGIHMLRHTKESISSIASGIGYDYPNSFIKAFRKAYNASPLQYRKHEISNSG